MAGCPKCGSERWKTLWWSLLNRFCMVVECESCSWRWQRRADWIAAERSRQARELLGGKG